MHNIIKDKVLQSTDIVDVIGERVALTHRGKDFVGLCPFHHDHKPSLHVSPTKQIFKCFACGAGGDVISFVQASEKLSFREALALLAQRAGIDLRATDTDRTADRLREEIRQALVWARSHFQRNLQAEPGGKAAMEYALGRGLTRETIERHGLGLARDAWDDLSSAARPAGLSPEVLHQAGLITTNDKGQTYDRFRNRLIFPICDPLGRPIAFGGRTLGDDPAKYLNSPETPLFSKSRVLYGLDLARRAIQERREVVVVEGYTDAVLLHQFGFTHAVATLGTALTDAHVKLLHPLAQRVILCFDGDQAGMRAADRAVQVSLLGRMQVGVVVLEGGRDPADCVLAAGRPGFEQVLARAVDALQFKWEQTVKVFGDGDPGARRQAVGALLEFLASLSLAGGIDPLEQGFLIRRLGELLALPPESVHEMLAAATRRRRATPAAESGSAMAESAYAASVRALPAGLVAAAEDALGLMLTDCGCAVLADENLLQAAESCTAWKRLYALIRGVLAERGQYTRAELLDRCEDAELCELASRACARVGGTPAPEEALRFACERLRGELNAKRRGELLRSLSASGQPAGASDEVFNHLFAMARGQDFALAAEKRWNAEAGA